ncbi:cyclin-like protein interacting with PHO85 [Coemansia sp. RSA 2322]|nr:cyclin-like protein interacting with PHO85 [Coemansia sp. RSA 2322]
MFTIEHTPISLTIARMAELIDAVTAANHQSLGHVASDITPFHSRAVPAISVRDYLERVAKFVCLENDSLIAVLVYLDRVTRAQIHRPALAPSPFNIHRLLITAIVVAHKFNSDIFFNNARYSKVGGIPLAEMNQLELELLFLARFDLKIDASEMQRIGEWLLAPRASFLALGTVRTQHKQPNAVCILTPYHNDVALSRQIVRCKLEYPTPAMDPMPSTSSGIVVPPLDLAPSFIMHDDNDMCPHASSVARSTPCCRHQHHQQPLAQGTESALELTTPSSLNAPCFSPTPPCQGCPDCETGRGGAMLSQLNGTSFDSGGLVWPSSSSHHSYAPAAPTSNMALDVAATQKRRRVQALVSLSSPNAASVVPDVSINAATSHAVNVGSSGVAADDD